MVASTLRDYNWRVFSEPLEDGYMVVSSRDRYGVG